MEQSPMRVLHVDDDPDFLDITATYLKRQDDRFTVETEPDADAGLNRLAESEFDCVVSDYDMPGMDGIDFLQAVRDSNPELPFILFTGKGSEKVAGEAISADVTDYLHKGSGTEQYELLANRIINGIRRRRAHAQAQQHHRISSVVREISRVLVQARSREDIDHRVCQILTDADPYVFSWIGTVDTETKQITPTAAAGIGENDYLNSIRITADNSPTGNGPCGTAVREDRVVASQDIEQDDTFEPWREPAREHGYRAVASIPLTHEETQYGVLNVYADRTDAFDESERKLLSELGDTIAHAYSRIAARRDYEDQYRELFEKAPVMFAFTRIEDGEPVIEDCNQLFADTLGYTQAELRGSPLVDVYTKESAQTLSDSGYDRALSGEFVREQRELVTSDGDVVTTLLRATPRQNTDGEVVGTHALYVDITEQTRLQTLLKLRERIKFALDATNSTLLELDLSSGEKTRHGPFERLYGIKPEDISTTGEFYERCVHPDDRDDFKRIQQKDAIDMSEDGVVECEFRTHPDRGPTRWMRFKGYLSTSSDGTPQRLFGIDTDITEQKRHEQELRRRNEQLENFTSVMSHDLRNPLNVATGRVKLARDEYDSEHLDAAHDAHKRIDTLIDDLLNLARHGESVSDIEALSLADTAERCWTNVETTDAQLVIGSDREIKANRSRVQQLFENLIRNAVEHGGRDVTVTIGKLADGFYVEDDGPGIPEDRQNEVFDAGYTTADEGTGFGLSIVAHIADTYRWEVAVSESLDGGARFEFTNVGAISADAVGQDPIT